MTSTETLVKKRMAAKRSHNAKKRNKNRTSSSGFVRDIVTYNDSSGEYLVVSKNEFRKLQRKVTSLQNKLNKLSTQMTEVSDYIDEGW